MKNLGRILVLFAACLGIVRPIARGEDKPLKVFVLVGQSNMQGHAHVRTLEHLSMSDSTKPMLDDLQNGDGTPKVFEDIPISYLSNGGVKTGRLTTGFGANDEKIGPELTFGVYMQQRLDEPILIIKAAWGGKSIHTDFRPPSAGPYVFKAEQLGQLEKRGKDIDAVKAEKAEATGHYYRLMVEHVRSTLSDIKKVYPEYQNQGYELAGFVWFQGWNDMVDRGTYPQRDQPGGYGEYSEVMTHFIRDVRNDLEAPSMPFVIGVLGVNGPTSDYAADQARYRTVHQNFRDAMAAPAALPEFKGNVTAVQTELFWDPQLTALKSREAKIQQELRKLRQSESLSRQQEQSRREQLMAKEFSADELNVLDKAVSNAAYHYLGSAKIMTGIGKGFADALAALQ